uniref:Uncharacterized protein n=1 Tax=Eubacterium cellulosolvens (strain ATCC 43171 / JCM 9499 / 6) TaxID=633697 RepID=I5AXD8_EUBC6
MFCVHCGKELPDIEGMKFCQNCGGSLDAVLAYKKMEVDPRSAQDNHMKEIDTPISSNESSVNATVSGAPVSNNVVPDIEATNNETSNTMFSEAVFADETFPDTTVRTASVTETAFPGAEAPAQPYSYDSQPGAAAPAQPGSNASYANNAASDATDYGTSASGITIPNISAPVQSEDTQELQRIVLIISTVFSAFGIILPMIRIHIGGFVDETFTMFKLINLMTKYRDKSGSDDFLILLVVVCITVFLISAGSALLFIYYELKSKVRITANKHAFVAGISAGIGLIILWLISVIVNNSEADLSSPVSMTPWFFALAVASILTVVLAKRRSH